MRLIADLHIHSHYSRATSLNMNLKDIQYYGKIKGLDLTGTGDFTHPKWYHELKDKLCEKEGSGLYYLKSSDNVLFILSCEVATIFEFEGEKKRIHHVILSPSLDNAEDIVERLSRYGDLTVDGRPILNITAAELVEDVLESSKMNFVFPAHVWTPWFSLFGSNSGFDTVRECYQDMTDHIFALETGLSSDPPMNWRLSALDKYTLISNSDSHSAWPWRIGREANVFEIEDVSYRELIDSIKSGDKSRFRYTIETYPQYGKYHWTGHRNCGVSFPPKLSITHRNRCPKCGRRMATGVEQRIEELADREEGVLPSEKIGYKHIIPLSEIIAYTINVESSYAQKVWDRYNILVGRFGSEFNILLDTPIGEIERAVGRKLAQAIDDMRRENIVVTPGYDGVYGKVRFNIDPINKPNKGQDTCLKRRGLWEYINEDEVK